MRSLWGWVLSSRKTDGTPRATNGDEAMSWVQSYFRRASENLEHLKALQSAL